MKRILARAALYAITSLTLVSCYNDDRDPVETMYSGFVTAQTDSKGYVTKITNDFGTSYDVKQPDDKYKLRPDTLYRLVVSVALDENKDARILQMAKTMSYNARPDSIVKDTTRDPVLIESRYIGGGYLNIVVGIKVQNEESAKKHELGYTRLDTPGRLTFTIRHNAHEDKEVYTKHAAYISIPLKEYGLSKNDTVFLTCKGYQEDYDIRLEYK